MNSYWLCVSPQGTVGAFEGVRYFHCGIYRPEFNGRMRALEFPFCAVYREVIHNTLCPYLIPITQIHITVTTGNKDIDENDEVCLGHSR